MKNIIFVLAILVAFTSFSSCDKCEKIVPAPCLLDPADPKVDLIVLIDASGSMANIANAISNASQAAIAAAQDSCPVDLQVTFLGLEGTWPGTVFNNTQRNYINSCQGGPVTLAADLPQLGLSTEQGANGIEDLSNYACWRPGACRAIFYISDEELDGSSPRQDFANEDLVTQSAIAAASSPVNSVTVFSHFINYNMVQDPTGSWVWGQHPTQISQNYFDMSDQTGGLSFETTGPTIPPNLYVDLFPSIVCNACNGCELNQFQNQN